MSKEWICQWRFCDEAWGSYPKATQRVKSKEAADIVMSEWIYIDTHDYEQGECESRCKVEEVK